MFPTNKQIYIFFLSILMSFTLNSQLDFGNTSLPSRLGNAKNWKLIEEASDDFNYTFNPTNSNADFGPSGKPAKWNNFFHNGWDGPGPTKWQRNHVAVSGGSLNVWASRRFFDTAKTKPYMKSFDWGDSKISRPETISGCITSKKRVKYPVFVEAKLKVMNSPLASDIWLLSPDDKEEIDIIECYGGRGDDGRNNFFAERVHLSHHVFKRPPNFKDYQPSDWNSWYTEKGVKKWGGRIVRIGVYWKSPTVVEYYIDGNLVRVLDNDAMASRLQNGTWEYTYPGGVTSTGNNGVLKRDANGYQLMKVSSTSNNFNQNNLNAAKSKSNISVIDPFDYLSNGRKFSREMDIIINVEDQNWQAESNRSPNNTEIQNFNNNNLLVDWIRVLKPKENSNEGNNDGTFYIKNRETGGRLASNGGNNFSNLQMVSSSTNTNIVKWKMIDAGNGYFYIQNVETGYLFRPFSDSNGSNIQQVPNTYRGDYTQWKKVNSSNGYFYLQNKQTGMYFRPENSNNAAKLQQRPSNWVGTWTQWKFIETNTGLISRQLESLSKEEKVNVYPNPASLGDLVTVITAGTEIIVTDFNGRIIQKKVVVNGKAFIDTSNLDKGVYFLLGNGKVKKLILK